MTMELPGDIAALARLLDDEDDDVAVNVLSALLAREDELGQLPAILQENPEPLVRKRAHQLQAALTFRRRRRDFYANLNSAEPDYFTGLIDLHMLWFDRDSRTGVKHLLDDFVGSCSHRQLLSLEDMANLMRKCGFNCDFETILVPENYCIGTVIDQRSGSTGVLMGLLRHLGGISSLRVVRLLGEFALYDGEGRVLTGQGEWRVSPAPGVEHMEFWDDRSLLRYFGNMLFSAAVSSDSHRYVLTIAQALTGYPGGEILERLPWPYGSDRQ